MLQIKGIRKMLYLKWIFLLSLCGFTGFSLASDKRSQYPGVVALVSKDKQHIGTGFFIQSDILATAFHVVEDFKGPLKEALFFKDPHKDTFYPVTGILALDMEYDLAVLKTEGYHSETFYPLDLSDKTERVSIGKQVIFPGFPEGEFHLQKGRVRMEYNYNVYIYIRHTDRKTNHFDGMSGGPVFSQKAYLEGVVTAGNNFSSSVETLQFVSVARLRDLLSDSMLSCVTHSCIDEEKEKWHSQALAGDSRGQFIMGYWEYQWANKYVAELLKPLGEWLLPTTDEQERQRLERITDGLFQKYEIAASWFERAAKQGHAEAQYFLTNMYAIEGGVIKNLAKTIYWLHQVGKQGHAKAQFTLAMMYADGEGVGTDLTQAVYWLRLAAEQNYVEAQYHLGLRYLDGLEDAASWFHKAAQQDHIEAQYHLGLMYANGEGVELDLLEAAYWFLEAAQQGHIEAQYALGALYNNGQGVEQNIKEAAYWLKKAAQQGHIEAQYYLAGIYTRGNGVKKDLSQASSWFHEAAQQGHVEAQYNIGWMYFNGQGVERDLSEAAYWLNKAVLQGHTEAQTLIENVNKRFQELEESWIKKIGQIKGPE